MAAEVPSDGRDPEPTQFPFYTKPPAPSFRPLDTLGSMMIYPVTGEELSQVGSNSGGCYSPGSDGPDSITSPGSAAPDGPAVLPPLPPPHPPPAGAAAAMLLSGSGAHGSVDESDQQDGAEYEEEEAVFSLSAPPTNQ